MSIPLIGQTQSQVVEGPQIRILICFDCKTIDEVPDFDGPSQYDYLLQKVIDDKHTDPVTGTPHRGDLGRVPVKVWADRDAQKRMIKQYFTGSAGLGEFDESFYDTRSVFYEDAMQCYSAHLRPSGQCPDYLSDKKILLPDTKAERKELGLPSPSKAPGPKNYLCFFCPVHVFNQRKAREQKGLYK